MKPSLSIGILVKTLIAGSIFSLCSVAPALGESVSVTKDSVNIRTGPGTKHPIYMEVFKGYPLKVLKRQGDWIHVSDVDKDTGWIFASLTRKGSTTIVNAKKSANMRSGPSTDSPIIANVQRGVVLEKLDSQGDWQKLKHTQGTIGWMHKKLLWP